MGPTRVWADLDELTSQLGRLSVHRTDGSAWPDWSLDTAPRRPTCRSDNRSLSAQTLHCLAPRSVPNKI